MMQTFAKIGAQHRQLQAQTRAQMLAALSPAHRLLVATLVGQLAVAPNPDQAATARQLDGALSASEQQAILRVNAGALAQAQAMAQQMQSQFLSQMTPEQRSAMQRDFAQMKAEAEKRLTPEQRIAIERKLPQLKAMMPPGAMGGMLVPSGFAQDAGSVLLRTLTTPNLMAFGISTHANASGGALSNTIIQTTP